MADNYEYIKRFIPFAESELSVDSKGDVQVIHGYAAKFNVVSGNMFKRASGRSEMIRTGFFRDALALDEPILCLFNHDENYILGERDAGTLVVDEDKIGLPFEAKIPDGPIIRELVVGPIVRKETKGCSFSAFYDENLVEYDRKSGVLHLMPGGAKQIPDVGPVTHPAFTSTEVYARSVVIFERAKRKANPREASEQIYHEFQMQKIRNRG